MEEKNIVKEVDGYFTFNEVENAPIRFRNRGNALVNIVDDTTREGGSKELCWERVKSYLSAIPEKEIPATYSAFMVAAAMRCSEPCPPYIEKEM